jgi:hypothetical protein
MAAETMLVVGAAALAFFVLAVFIYADIRGDR